jgi:hypothetical protein
MVLDAGQEMHVASRSIIWLRRPWERTSPIVRQGLREWDNVNVHDLSDLFVLLVEAAIGEKKDDPEIWGKKGYFLAENRHYVWGEVSKQVAEETYKQGYIKTKEV